MNAGVLTDLRCPACGSGLECEVFEGGEAGAEEGGDRVVQTGVLTCRECRLWYPILNYVPILLLFRTEYHKHFAAQWSRRLSRLGDYTWVSGRPEKGEKFVQGSFSAEWSAVEDDELTFTYTDDDLTGIQKRVFLNWQDGQEQEIGTVLNVGCGFGKEALSLKRVCPRAKILAMDLNFSLLRAGPKFRDSPDINLVIASLFHPPLSPRRYDLVYSHGVLHHTHSTHKAFQSIERFVASRGYLSIWLYAIEDHILGGPIYVARFWIEGLVRPVVSRLPLPLRSAFIRSVALVVHPWAKSVVRHKEQWKFRNTVHHVYDYLGPRYARRHGFNEVVDWFETAGYSVRLHSPRNYRELLGGRRLWGVGVTGRKL